VVAHTAVDYLRPARLDDEIDLTVALGEAGRVALTIEQQAWRGDDLLAQGAIRIGCVDAGTLKPQRIPKPILERIA
jgi:acyl-CoA thioester hydrolase